MWFRHFTGNLLRSDSKGNVYQGAVTSSGQGSSFPADVATTSFSISTAEDNGTWLYEITETVGGLVENTSEVWFSNSVTSDVYRAYSSWFDNDSVVPDHVELVETDGIAIDNGADTETVSIQIVDSAVWKSA